MAETTRRVEHHAVVAEVIGPRQVVLTIGSSRGVREGQKFVVFGVGPEIKDPRTDESLGQLEVVKGKGRVIHVQESMCTIETYEFEVETQRYDSGRGHALGWLGGPQEIQSKSYRSFEDVEVSDFARMIS